MNAEQIGKAQEVELPQRPGQVPARHQRVNRKWVLLCQEQAAQEKQAFSVR